MSPALRDWKSESKRDCLLKVESGNRIYTGPGKSPRCETDFLFRNHLVGTALAAPPFGAQGHHQAFSSSVKDCWRSELLAHLNLMSDADFTGRKRWSNDGRREPAGEPLCKMSPASRRTDLAVAPCLSGPELMLLDSPSRLITPCALPQQLASKKSTPNSASLRLAANSHQP